MTNSTTGTEGVRHRAADHEPLDTLAQRHTDCEALRHIVLLFHRFRGT